MLDGKHDVDNLLEREDAALIVIDVQERLLPAMANREALLANLVKLVRFANLLKIPVLATEQIKLGPTVAEITDVVPEIETFTKVEFDALRNPQFAERLNALGKGTLIVAGIEAHICVTQTVIHVLPRHRVHVIADAISSRAEENRRVAVARMQSAGAIVSSTEMLMYELLQRAGTDEFRAVLEMVKS